MGRPNSDIVDKITKVLIDYCDNKRYTVKNSKESNGLRFDISDYHNRVTIHIYNTGSVQVQGKETALKDEFKKWKQDFFADPQTFIEGSKENKFHNATYDLLSEEIRKKIKKSLSNLEIIICEIEEKPDKNTEYRAKLIKNSSSITLTQYFNGTLLLQGKTDYFFDEICSHIEKTANPAEKEVIARFISSDEGTLEYFTSKYTPKLLEQAEKNVEDKLGRVYGYLKPHDRSWFIASEYLCSIKIPLDEFSPIVMPASKAFEGFAMKILIDIGLLDSDHFEKGGNFSPLSDWKNERRKAICNKDMHANSHLRLLNTSLDINRNFLMHSDTHNVTKVKSQKDAEERLNEIHRDTRQIFDYFDSIYNIV